MKLLLIFLGLLAGFHANREDAEVVQFLQEHAETLGLTKDDLKDLSISSVHQDRKTGIHFFYVQQNYAGYRIEGALAIVLRETNQQLKLVNHSFVVGLSDFPTPTKIISSKEAMVIGGNYLARSTVSMGLNRQVWIFAENKWQLTYDIRLDHDDQHFQVSVNCENASVVRVKDLVLECAFGAPQIQDQCFLTSQSMGDISSGQVESYLVYPWPIESPNHGERQLVTAPADGNASPFGWHDINGAEGFEYTDTRGNNVFAQSDFDGFDVSENRPDAGTNLFFNYELDLNHLPNQSINAATTNLFYWNNLNHDIFYHYGFDEAAGNFQVINYQRGGQGNDQVFADAQDGSDINNARFFTSEDGIPGRMQMYLWRAQLYDAMITLNDSQNDPLVIDAVESGFSKNNKLLQHPLPSGLEIVLINDQGSDLHLGCLSSPIANMEEISGKIALIDRGTCFFVEKVKRVQDLGALGVIIGNNVPEAPFAMGGDDPSITIPAVMVTLDKANLIKEAIQRGEIKCDIDPQPNNRLLDSSLDNLIISHEYGHGISTRLIGGANSIECLDNGEQMGEGWSDYFGLMLTTDWQTAQPSDLRGVGTYVTNENISGRGLRSYPYSTNQVINPMNYDDIKNLTLPHDVGAVWCSMLWDLTWNIIETEGISTDMYYGQAGNNIALQLVMTGLKLTRCYPGFVNGRDAILQADSILYQGKHQYQIWKAFARRGVGYSADQGNSYFTFDAKSARDMPPQLRTSVEYFDASDQTDHIELDFRTLREYDTESLIIERSVDKIQYEPIAEFKSALYQPSPRLFHHRDEQVEAGKIYYYRLLSNQVYQGVNIIGMDSATLIPVEDILFFPNPSEGVGYLKVNQSLTGLLNINLFSATGQLMFSKSEEAEALHARYPIDISSFPPGVYHLVVATEDKSYHQKIIRR
ncbi:MAG: M36 family metallopeptidase [Saprospiraceae bacterium]|nr:M36 family metallopeptidase [Saprospiraceae bacterium]